MVMPMTLLGISRSRQGGVAGALAPAPSLVWGSVRRTSVVAIGWSGYLDCLDRRDRGQRGGDGKNPLYLDPVLATRALG